MAVRDEGSYPPGYSGLSIKISLIRSYINCLSTVASEAQLFLAGQSAPTAASSAVRRNVAAVAVTQPPRLRQQIVQQSVGMSRPWPLRSRLGTSTTEPANGQIVRKGSHLLGQSIVDITKTIMDITVNKIVMDITDESSWIIDISMTNCVLGLLLYYADPDPA
jgi:hypothetical protein